MRMINPYHDLFRELAELGPRESDGSDHLGRIRKQLIWAYSWAVPNDESILELVRHSPLIEVGAGTGYWAWLCRQAGGDILALDRNPAAPPRWHPIEEGGPEALVAHPERTLFLCWPPFEDPMARECLRHYGGQTVIHVGERRGRTGDGEFHDELERGFRPVGEVAIPSWPGFRDRMTVYQRECGHRVPGVSVS